MRKVNVAVVGCGNISGIYLKNLTTVFKNVNVYAIADLIEANTKAKSEEYGIERIMTLEEILADENVEIVLNLTTPPLHYGISKQPLPKKLFGVFPHNADYKRAILLRGFDDEFWAPHSRHTTIDRADIEAVPGLKILASSEEAGVYIVMNKEGRQIFVTGHSEYDPDTLEREYLRDKNLGLPIHVPVNYYPNDDDTKPPVVRWRGHGNLLYSNWLNYFVYQTTPYDIMAVGQDSTTD